MAWASPSRLHAGPSGAAALHASPQPTRDGVRPRASVPARPAAASRAPRRQSTAQPKCISFPHPNRSNTDEKREAAPQSPSVPAQIYRYPRPHPPEITPFHQIRPGPGLDYSQWVL
jgi:hypothetical protein